MLSPAFLLVFGNDWPCTEIHFLIIYFSGVYNIKMKSCVILIHPLPISIFMKPIFNMIRAVNNISSDEFPKALSILLIVFFVVFGIASMYILL